ncbi:hypothetical protein ABZW03_24805 [Kitasatospora sp. NPDC004799]|uniref:hypothetical protein n=1 Tax=Kitasatospora sp. NPDC004799 TaxID=3154460 RepID=UPI0033A86261
MVAGTGTRIYLFSLQGSAPAEIVVRVWDGPAATGGDWGAEGEREVELETPTGCVVIRAFSPEIAGDFQLPCPKVYEGRVSWKGRQTAEDQQNSLRAQLATQASQLNPAAVFAAHHETLETYRIDLWWSAESEEDEEDE